MTACSSDVVMKGSNGLIIRGASLKLTKIFAAAFIDYTDTSPLQLQPDRTTYAYFRCCGVQTVFHQPGNLTDDILHDAQIVEHIENTAQKDNGRRHLEGKKVIFVIGAENE